MNDSITTESKINDLKSEYSYENMNKSKKKPKRKKSDTTTVNSKKTNNNEKIIKYKFEWNEGGENVQIAGDFLNDWNDRINLEKNQTTGIYEKILEVPIGVHQFKFIVDGKWVLSSNYNTIDIQNNITNNIKDFTNSIPEKNTKKKKKKLKESSADFNCNVPNDLEENSEPKTIPIQYNSLFNLNKQTKQEFLNNYFLEYVFDFSRNQIENNDFKSIMSLSNDKTGHICFNIENNSDINNKYISTSITQKNKHKYLTMIYYYPKK